jgi:hypothetical protein
VPLEDLGTLVGDWEIEATHPAVPDTIVRGRSTFEWLSGERFLIQRSETDHPDFPDGVTVTGAPEGELSTWYFDSRGVHRVYRMEMSDGVWKIWRDAPGFSQRFTGELSEDGKTISGLWKLSEDDETWNDDLEITYRKLA